MLVLLKVPLLEPRWTCSLHTGNANGSGLHLHIAISTLDAQAGCPDAGLVIAKTLIRF